MALEDAIISGSATLLIFVLSFFYYLRNEKKKYLQEKKIESYARLITSLEEFWSSLESDDIEYKRRAVLHLRLAISDVLFYGSDVIYRGIRNIFTPTDDGSRIHGKYKNELITKMLKEIDPKRTIQDKEIFSIQ